MDMTFAHDGISFNVMEAQSPLYLLLQDCAIGSILLSELRLAILHAEHHHRLGAIVVDGTLATGRDTHHAALLQGNVDTVNLVLALATKNEVKFLVVLVRMVEAAFLTRRVNLE